MKLAFIAGRNSTALHGQFDVDGLFENRALTGSESAFFNAARGLSARGHVVDVYCDAVKPVQACERLSKANVFQIDDLERRANEFAGEYEAFISLNEPDQFRKLPKNGLKIVQHQYNDFLNSQEGFDSFVDIYAFLSPVHRDHLVNVAKLPRGKACWVPNSIDVRMGAATVQGAEREAHTAVWCSSPDRGLHRLLEMWPAVRKKISDAKLKVFYRFWEWIEECKNTDSKLGVRARYIAECVRRLGSKGENGIYIMGAVPNVQIAAELRSARVFPYTCDCITFTEGFSVATMDAAWAGCVPIISDTDAIGDIYRECAVVIPGKPGEQKDQWVQTIVDAMSNPAWAEQVADKARQWSAKFDIERVACLWENLIQANKDKKSDFDFTSLPNSIEGFVQTKTAENDSPESEIAPQLVVTDSDMKRSSGTISQRSHFEHVSPKLRIAIILGKMSHAVHGIFNPDDLYERGQAMTGTGSNFFNLVWGLAERGHTIDAFTETTRNAIAHPRLAGANLYNLDSVEIGKDYQAYISVNEPDLLRPFTDSRVRICQMQLNDFTYAAGGFDRFVDYYVCPSDRHARFMAETTGLEREKIFAIPLSINAEFFDHDEIGRDPYRITYCSSPDRGLHNLLQIFPDIRNAIPGASLHVYYRLRPWLDGVLRTNHHDHAMRERAQIVEKTIQTMGSKGENGLFVHGPVPTMTMAKELLASSILAYPCDPVRFTEGFSISIMDACAAGCFPIISDADALPDVYTGAVKFVRGKPSEKKKEWTEAIINALTFTTQSDARRYAAKAFSSNFTRQKIAKLWESYIRERL